MTERKKKIVIVTGNLRVAAAIERDIRLVLGDSVEYEALLPPAIESMEHVRGDLFLLTRWKNIGGLSDKVDDRRRLLRISRTISREGLRGVLSIPPQSRVLVVNDSPKSTQDLLEQLMDLHVEGLTYVPYERGMYDPTLTVAITPDEAAYVPNYIERIIDVGQRMLSMPTILDALAILQLNSPEISRALMDYTSRIAHLGGTGTQYRDAVVSGERIRVILSHMEQGVLLTLPSGEIVLSNARAEQFAGCAIPPGSSLREAFPPETAEALRGMGAHEARTFSIRDRDIIVSHETVRYSSNIHQELFFLSDITYLNSLEQSLSARAREKGFVAKYHFSDLLHRSAAMEECIERMKLFAASDKTVLIEGESGVGKELLAQSLHNSSARRGHPFVAVNCAALPESLLESELFGYERGAFTGARQGGKPGLFEQANGGTIFLDEIGDMPVSLQARLLRALQEKQVMRLGGDHVLSIDVRVIAATNQNLRQKLGDGTFRQDLFYRLSVLPCRVPALRERPEDILPLFRRFTGLTEIPEAVAAALRAYAWPGNVRELQNAADYYTMMHGREHPLPEYLHHPAHAAEKRTPAAPPGDVDHAVLALLKHGGLGRVVLLKRLHAQGYSFGEYTLRGILCRLEEAGLIMHGPGRNGSTLTEHGRQWLTAADGQDPATN
jgi:transcriptional regulator with PAS, ATPase and Fis domain